MTRRTLAPAEEIIDSLQPDWSLMVPPLLRERPGYSWEKFRAALSGAMVAKVSIPPAIGFALLAELPPSMVLGSVVLRVLKNSGLLRRVGVDNVFPAELNPNLATKKALERSRTLLAGAQPNLRLYSPSPSIVVPADV